MQGYLTDPTAFGASNRLQALLPRPGNYFSVGAVASRRGDQHANTPSFIANGYANSTFPLAYFVEGTHIDLSPAPQSLNGVGVNLTTALGMSPREDFGVFAFANTFEARLNYQPSNLVSQHVSGRESRLDFGLNFKFSPTSQSWLKFGMGEKDARVDEINGKVGTSFLKYFQPHNQDIQCRHSLRIDDREWTWGLESARMEDNSTSVLEVYPKPLGFNRQVHYTLNNLNKSLSIYGAINGRISSQLRWDTALFYQEDELVPYHVGTRIGEGGTVPLVGNAFSYESRKIYPRFGIVYSPPDGWIWRLAWQKWLRPISSNTISPVATAGIVLDDQMVLPGGVFERLRFQFERELTANMFVKLFLDAKRIHNLGQHLDVLNQRIEVADLDRLRNRAALEFQNKGEALEQTPVFLEGRTASAGVSLNQRITNNFSGFATYVYSESENTHHQLADSKLPYLPRHHLTLGATWIGPQRLVVQGATVYRSRRFTDENNSIELAAGWDVALKATF